MKRRCIPLILVMLFAFMFCCGFTLNDNTPAISSPISKDSAVELAEKFILDYENALVTLQYPDFSYVDNNDQTTLFLERLRYKIEFAKVFSTSYTDLNQEESELVSYEENNGKAFLTLYAAYSYHYNTAPQGLKSGHGMLYQFEVSNKNNQAVITSIQTDSNDFIFYADQIKAEASSKAISFANAAKNVTDSKIASLDEQYDFWCEQVSNFDNINNDNALEDTEEPQNPRNVSVSYNRSAAVEYAVEFGDVYENRIFKRMSADCTNFVSQCLWAGYGGTNGYSLSDVVELRERVADNYRQTTDWFGRNYNSSSQYATGPFMRVVELWSYATGNTGDGPRATGYNDGNVWTSLSVVPQTGDILQFYSTSLGRYNHSVIVTTTNSPTLSNMLNRVWISQHSGDYVNRPLSETLDDNGGITNGRMRLMRPVSTTFDS